VNGGFRRVVDRAARRAGHHLETTLGGRTRTRVVVLLASVLALSSADTATVGASATQLRAALHISNTDIGLLVAVTSLTGALGSLPFGVLADRVNRTRTMGIAIVVWGAAMVWSATVGSFGRLLEARLFLGLVTAAAGPVVASLIGDYFPSSERGRIYSYVLSGELLGAGAGFAITGDLAALSWRVAFVALALPAFVLARYVWRMPEPARGGTNPLPVVGGPADDTRLGDGPAAAGAGAGAADPTVAAGARETDAQRLARERGIAPDGTALRGSRLRRVGLWQATRYVLGIRTNVILIVAGSLGYFYLAGVETFGVEFVTKQYSIDQVLADILLLVIGAGAVVGVVVAGRVSDWLLIGRRYLNGRVLVAAVLATATTVLFVPALITRSAFTALPYVVFAAFALAGQNPPIDAARLDIVPPALWGRAEGIRTTLRTVTQASAPLLFGVIADDVFGGGRSGLQWTFIVMLAPLAANALYMWRALSTYPRDVATAAAATVPEEGSPPAPPVTPQAGTRRA
jgi:MFS family permease